MQVTTPARPDGPALAPPDPPTGAPSAPRAPRAWALWRAIRDAVPRGHTLPAEAWQRRHRWLLVVLWAHALALPVYGFARGNPLGHCLLEGGVVAVLAAVATVLGRHDDHHRLASCVVATGLLSSSAIVVHFSEGYIEAHFHFFVMLVALTLYEEWLPFLLAAAYVALHHGVLGVLAPEDVYNHPDAAAHPWRWALIHAGFIGAAGAFAVAAWRLNEDVREEKELALERTRTAERALAATAEDLRRSNRELEQYAYVASHDLVEPLRSVTGFLELLEQRSGAALDERSRLYVRHAQEGTERMKQLVDDLLQFARAGRLGREEDVRLGDVVDDVTAMLFDAIRRTGAEVAVAGELPTVRGDRGQLRQVVQNLVGNALKFGRDGVPPQVTVSARQLGDGAGWELSVRDNGIGIAPEAAERIFALFGQLHPQERYGGSGIGLAICERIVERHGGRIWVESPPSEGDGTGTAFRFTLPPAPPVAAPLPDAI